MLKGKWQAVAMHFVLCLLLFFIPFPFIFSAASLGACAVLWLLGGRFKETFTNLRNRKLLWPWIIFFLLHAISYTYSDNKAQSSFDLQSKLSFLILPLVLGAGTQLNRKTIERMLLFFTLGITAIAVFCEVQAVLRCKEAGYLYKPFFFYNELVEGVGPSAVYMAWYVLFSIAVLILMPWQYCYKGGWRILRSILIALQVVFFLQLSARMLIVLFFLFVLPVYISRMFKRSRIRLWQTASLAMILIATGLAVAVTDNPVKRRFDDIFEKNLNTAYLNDYRNVPQEDFSNLTIRLMVWRFGYENMKEQNLWLLGAGNGDVQDLQNRKMAAYGIDVNNPDPKKRSEYYNVNLHNMPMQSFMMLGIPGLIFTIIIIFAPLFYVQRIELKHLFIVFHITGVFFLMQEAALQTQAGIIYYTFFSILFYNILYTRADNSGIEDVPRLVN